jgi:hypothetical protein
MNNKVACLLKKELDELNYRKKTIVDQNNHLLGKKQQINTKLEKLKYEQKSLSTELFDTSNKINSNYKKFNDLEEIYQTKLVMYENEKAKFFTSNLNQELIDLISNEDQDNLIQKDGQIQSTAQSNSTSITNNLNPVLNANNIVTEAISSNNKCSIDNNNSATIHNISLNSNQTAMIESIDQNLNRNNPTTVNLESTLSVNNNWNTNVNNISINNAISCSDCNKENTTPCSTKKRNRDTKGIYIVFLIKHLILSLFYLNR